MIHYSQKLEQYYEDQYCKQLLKEGKNSIIKLRKETKLYQNKYKSSQYRKEIWIISDRKNKAGDNGEYFFRYLRNRKPEGIKPFTVCLPIELTQKKVVTLYARIFALSSI